MGKKSVGFVLLIMFYKNLYNDYELFEFLGETNNISMTGMFWS
jgi:hypothetical protein